MQEILINNIHFMRSIFLVKSHQKLFVSLKDLQDVNKSARNISNIQIMTAKTQCFSRGLFGIRVFHRHQAMGGI